MLHGVVSLGGGMPKSKTDSNAALAQKLLAAEAKAAQAQARVSLTRAQIEVKGKQITYDWKNGEGKLKVVDRQIK
jgi:hypothetical protein